ncbi:uncharacterized protein LOC141617822 [Silene latifolia]|uniref:uncharacterized protein LOC141617822 n=1 Tax=Silene latifolia TaxID=37657 RepID=UPI003D779082
MRKPELSGCMSKWYMHLHGYDIQYEPQTAIKSQALADFMSDFSPTIQNMVEKEILSLEESREGEAWTMEMDRALNQKGAGVGSVLRSPQGDLIVQAVRCELKATNEVYSDSLHIVNHVSDSYAARDSKMIAYLKVANGLKQKFKAFKIVQIPRDHNVEANALSTLGATFKPTELFNILIVHVIESAIQKLMEADRGQAGETARYRADKWDRVIGEHRQTTS